MKRKQQYKLLVDRTIQEVDKISGPEICLEILALSLCIGMGEGSWEKKKKCKLFTSVDVTVKKTVITFM